MILRIIKIAFNELQYWLYDIIKYIPGNIGIILRYNLYKHLFAGCGKNVNISQGCHIRDFKNISIGSNLGLGPISRIYAAGMGNERIEIGDNVSFNSNVMVNADIGGNIQIGDNVMIGPNVVLRTSNHKYSDAEVPMIKQGHTSGYIIIGEDVWIGANAVILPKVNIGKGAIVGAGAVVTKNVEEFSIVAGVPAIMISKRTRESE